MHLQRKEVGSLTALGIILVLVTLGVAVAIGRKANKSVRSFDDAKHENFIGSE